MLVEKVEIGSRRTRRRLLIRPGAIGDFILSLPALEHLRASYTEVWTPEANLPLVRFADAKRSIISAGLDRVAVMDAGEVIERLRQFDSIVSWYGANRPDFRAFVAAAQLPFEFHPALPPADAGIVLSIAQPPAGVSMSTVGAIHAVDYYCAQVGAAPGAVPQIDVGAVDPHGSVVIHPFASHPEKRWPYSLDLRLTAAHVVLLRGPHEQLPGALFIPDLFALARFLAGARAYIGNDSGITHLAAAVGIPTIALFGPTNPAVWGPRGPSVRILRAPRMADIAPQTVIDALSDFGL